MAKMNFYTANGWAGSNYDSKLQTKDVAAKVRAYAKKKFPAFKFSITSRWSMYTDSLYIVLKSGPCVPFVEGSKLANRGHFETMSSVKSWEKDGLTPEVFAALDGVTSYASSFRYDDSDGMQDYFDTNFFLKIEIDDDYKLLEPKTKKQTTKKTEEPEKVETSTSVEGLEIVDYSEKAIAVFGETKEIKEQLKELGGKFNPALKYNDEKRAGWIFSKKQAKKVRALLAPSAEVNGGNENESDEYIKLNEVSEPYSVEENQRQNGSFPVKSILESLKYYIQIGNITIEEAAEELKEAGYINDIDTEKTARILDLHLLGEIAFTQTNEFNRVCYFDIEGAGIITSAKVRADIQLGDVFNVYTNIERKYGVEYDGISPESSLYKALPGIIETNNKLEAQTFSIAPKELPANVEFYEKKVTGQRYTVNNRPDKFGCFHIVDNLDNSACDFYPNKKEAEHRAEYLNSLVNESGQIERVI